MSYWEWLMSKWTQADKYAYATGYFSAVLGIGLAILYIMGR